ncbi:MAG TPA: hypothetical protein VGQ64_05235 [Candidatus Limnocylindrales bacterium]|nr:hypothetical protein [Candidatus Limnocylindrales bacterium]
MVGDELAGGHLLKTMPMETAGGLRELVYVWEGPEGAGRELLRIGTAELPDWRLAHERLAAPPDNPGAIETPGSVGDIAVVERDPETDLPVAISFARGNAYVSVRSAGDRVVDVTAAVERLDQSMRLPLERSGVDGARVEEGVLEVTSHEDGEERVIIESIVHTAHGGWLKVLAPDGELRREGDSLIYVARSVGPTRIRTFVMRLGTKRHTPR